MALLEVGQPMTSGPVQAARRWLVTHQDSATGAIPAASVNERRDPATDAARFMTDAATGYASLALAR